MTVLLANNLARGPEGTPSLPSWLLNSHSSLHCLQRFHQHTVLSHINHRESVRVSEGVRKGPTVLGSKRVTLLVEQDKQQVNY